MLARDIKENFRSIYKDAQAHAHMNTPLIQPKVTFVAHLPFNNPLNGCNFAI